MKELKDQVERMELIWIIYMACVSESAEIRKLSSVIPAGISLLKVNYKNTGTRCEICWNLTIKTPERRHSFKQIIAVWELNAQ